MVDGFRLQHCTPPHIFGAVVVMVRRIIFRLDIKKLVTPLEALDDVEAINTNLLGGLTQDEV